VVPVCAKTEFELSELSDEDKKEYLKEIGMENGNKIYMVTNDKVVAE